MKIILKKSLKKIWRNDKKDIIFAKQKQKT
jgi:hypothetical protein